MLQGHVLSGELYQYYIRKDISGSSSWKHVLTDKKGAYAKPGSWFNIKMPSYQCRNPHSVDKTILRSSYLHNTISYTGKMSSSHWIRTQFRFPFEPLLYVFRNMVWDTAASKVNVFTYVLGQNEPQDGGSKQPNFLWEWIVDSIIYKMTSLEYDNLVVIAPIKILNLC